MIVSRILLTKHTMSSKNLSDSRVSDRMWEYNTGPSSIDNLLSFLFSSKQLLDPSMITSWLHVFLKTSKICPFWFQNHRIKKSQRLCISKVHDHMNLKQDQIVRRSHSRNKMRSTIPDFTKLVQMWNNPREGGDVPWFCEIGEEERGFEEEVFQIVLKFIYMERDSDMIRLTWAWWNPIHSLHVRLVDNLMGPVNTLFDDRFS